jgi:hypothetical protein
MLTNRRIVFHSGTSMNTFSAALDELATVKCLRHSLRLNTLVVETSQGRRVIFETKKMACKKIVARSQMRHSLATSGQGRWGRPLVQARSSSQLQPPNSEHAGGFASPAIDGRELLFRVTPTDVRGSARV